jgi:group I intron endonuclease
MPADDPTTSGVYILTCAANGRIYIGSAANFAERWRIHRRDLNAGKHHSRQLQRAWDKYGPDAFTFEILEMVADSGQLLAAEQRWLDQLRPFEKGVGFNTCPLAASRLGTKMREESKVRQSARKKEFFADPENRVKAGNAWRGKRQPPEMRAKRSESLKGHIVTSETRAKIAETQRGREVPAARRARIAATLIGHKLPPEVIAQREETRRAKGNSGSRPGAMSADGRARISVANKTRTPNVAQLAALAAGRNRKIGPDEIARRLATRKARGTDRHPQSPETRAKISASLKARHRQAAQRTPAEHQATLEFSD